MNYRFFRRKTQTLLRLTTFTITLLATTALPILTNLPFASATTDTYPTSIAGCRYSSGTPAGYYTCDLKDDTQNLWFDPWGEFNRQCTSYAAWMLHSVNGFEMPFFDDATNWGTRASALGYTVDMNPKIGSIYWSTSIDHVGYVTDVSADHSQVTYADYNYTHNGTFGGRTVTTSSASGYIHFKDTAGGGGTSFPGVGNATYVGNHLNAGQALGSNQYITSSNLMYVLFMQPDGNLVLYNGNSALWNSQTAGHAGV
jgi:surface antigen